MSFFSLGAKLFLTVLAVIIVGAGISYSLPTPTLETPATEVVPTETKEPEPVAVAPEEKSAPVKPKETVSSQPAPKTIAPPAPAPVVIQTIEIPFTAPAVASTAPLLSLTELNDKTRAALVNILCTTKSGGSFRPITGSGVLIDKRGVILTNAHVAEYLLLKDYLVPDFVECVVRTGSPAQPKYKAELLYISPAWISENRANIREENPQGTGEHDFALLRITGPVGPSIVMPQDFPYLDIAANDSEIVDEIPSVYIAAGYPAGFLGGIAVQRDLSVASAVTTVHAQYRFTDGDFVDLISIGGSVLAQKGASGGAVTNQRNGKLVGIIVTTTSAAMTDDRSLQAVTVTHMSRSLKDSVNLTLTDYIAGDLMSKAEIFNREIAPALKDILLAELSK